MSYIKMHIAQIRVIRTAVVLCSLFSCLHSYPQGSTREEFNGPFASWVDVKKRFGVKGDGKSDDSKGLQAAIDSISVLYSKEFNTNVRSRYLVIYLPAGVYKITQTLRVEGKIGFSIIGEDPGKTILRWAGKPNDTMLVANGSSYYKISRLTWDAGNIKNIEGLGIHWLNKEKGTFAATSVELSDMIFKGGLAYGIFGGTYGGDGVGANDAEVVIRRCRFENCSVGIGIRGFNTLDYWIWDCIFSDCKRGIECRHGNYHVYNSHFYRSVETDIYNQDGYYTSVRGCYSKDSEMFSFDEGASCNAFKRIFEANIVEGFRKIPIEYHSQGRITLLDNYFFKNGNQTDFTINYSSWCPATYQVLSINNYFEEEKSMYLGKDFPTKVFSVADRHAALLKVKIARPAVSAAMSFAPFVKRKVFEVPPSADRNKIQSLINECVKMKGERPVLHFPPGTYILDKELVIPAGSDLQMIGDGMIGGTVFSRNTTTKDQYCIVVKGPSSVSMQNFELRVQTESNGISFENVDQPKAEVHIDQLHTSQVTNSVFCNRLDNLYMEKNNSFFSAGNLIIGGERMKNGNGTAVLNCFGGQIARTTLQNNGVIVAKDCWWEGASKKDYLPIDLKGEGRFTLDGSMLAPADLDSTVTIRINNFKGQVTISDIYMYGGIDINSQATDLKVLTWNVHFLRKQNPVQFLRQPFKPAIAMLGLTTQCFKGQANTCKDENILTYPDTQRNVQDINSFLYLMTRDLRNAKPRKFRNLESSITNAFIYRLSVTGGNTALSFNH